MKRIVTAMLVACAAISAASADDATFSGTTRFDLDRAEIREFVERAQQRSGIDSEELYALLAKAQPQPKILEAMSRPAERVLAWWEYRERFLTEQRIREGVEFWQAHRELIERTAAERGVAPEYIVAILGVETYYGRITGNFRVLDALATLAFDYPARGKFFAGELEQFVLLTREEGIDPLAARGSYAGAMGAPQFIPSSYRAYAVDGGNDNRRDLFSSWDDVLASVANYFREHGWRTGQPVLVEAELRPGVSLDLDSRNLDLKDTVASARTKGVVFETDLPDDTPVIIIPAEQQDGQGVRVGFRNFYVITRYNRSVRYAMAVHDLAQAVAARVYEPRT